MRASGEERQVADDVPEIRDSEVRARVREPVVGRILGERIVQEHGGGGSHRD